MLYFGSYYSKENTYWKHLHCCRISNLFCTRLKNRGTMWGLSSICHLFWSWKLCLNIIFTWNSCPHCYQNYWTCYESGRIKEKHGKRNLAWLKIVIFSIILPLIEKNNNVNIKNNAIQYFVNAIPLRSLVR